MIKQDRIAILKEYADYQWEKDSNFYVIFEHLGTNSEETQWVNYRLNEGKGIMVWGNHNHNYSIKQPRPLEMDLIFLGYLIKIEAGLYQQT